jgi:penicillin-binding protein 2
LERWHADDFDGMYALLSPSSQSKILRSPFEARYRGVLAEATVYKFETNLVAAGRTAASSAGAEFDLTYYTRLVGDLQFRQRINMVLIESDWRIAWTPALIIPALGDVNRLRLFPRTSTRGVIYDRNGEVLATQGTIVTIGVVPGQVENDGTLQALINELSGLPVEEIAAKYIGQPANWYIPIVDVPFEKSQAYYERLINTPGISLRERPIRVYWQGETASHLIGYVGAVNADELSALGERGYEETDSVGKQGIERSLEQLLAGKKGGRLVVLTPQGQEVETIADVAAVQSRSLHLSLDLNLQRICEDVLGERKGSIILLDVATGHVLAMASWPRYNPNVMIEDSKERQAIFQDPNQPLVNRATQAVYPSGSLFKIITMAAGMELMGQPATEPFVCPGYWNKFGFPMACWKKEGHGYIDMFHGLEQSCNIVFFETGYRLYFHEEADLQQMASAFGIGSLTGIEVDEVPGLLPTPEWKREVYDDVWVPGDTVNISIGQGFLQNTPAQMARVALGMASNGILHQLSLLDHTEDPTGITPPEAFPKSEAPRLPIAPEIMSTIREAMRAVAVPPRGTASEIFGNFPIAVAGKTGTAESIPGQDSHAWFAGFAPYEQPQLAFVSMLEFGGEGSSDAAPLIKEVLERYFKIS